jgi:inositol-phosphate phosphatase/L-galactose 1-phosphate phosphatase/histidinol-phosphatase
MLVGNFNFMAVDPAYIALAHRLADSAGSILRRIYRMPLAIEIKKDASPVTAADRSVETAMRDLITAQYPEHGIVGEEFGNVNPQAELQWVLDPIDGTRSFIAGYPLFTTLIALTHKGAPILGVIDQPVLGERWVGAGGIATLFNGKTTQTRRCIKPENAVLATTSTDYFTPRQAQSFGTLRRQCGSSVPGGDAYAYAMLAGGQIDIVVDAGMKPYDYCCLKPVIEGAGGIITDWNGRPLTLSSDGSVLAAATGELHKAALAVLG